VPQRVWVAQLVGEFGRSAEALDQIGQDALGAAAARAGGRRRKQATISRAKLRARHLAAQNLELVAQDQQLDVLDVHAAATPNERAQERPEREVEKRQGHYADPPNPSANGATRLLAPFRPEERDTGRRGGVMAT
jgi:hypothetical protein